MENKHRKLQDLAHQLETIAHELSALSGEKLVSPSTRSKLQVDEKFTGPAGGIKLLLREGFFTKPKLLSEVVARLHQDAFTYSPTVISNALIRFVKARTMVRIPATTDGKEKWAYAARK